MPIKMTNDRVQPEPGKGPTPSSASSEAAVGLDTGRQHQSRAWLPQGVHAVSRDRPGPCFFTPSCPCPYLPIIILIRNNVSYLDVGNPAAGTVLGRRCARPGGELA